MATTLTGIPATVGDPASTRTVYAIVIGLMLVGLVLVALGIWLVRQTRIDPELLGPLEQMANRRWRKLDPVGRRRLLDDARPDGAEPVRRTPTEPDVDRDFERSDHWAFARALELPVLYISAGEHEDYHRATDTAEKVDNKKVARFARLTLRLIAELQEDDLVLELETEGER